MSYVFSYITNFSIKYDVWKLIKGIASEVFSTVENIVKKKRREVIINVEKYLYIDWVLWNGK